MDSRVTSVFLIVGIIFVGYFLSYQLQVIFGKVLKRISKEVGSYSTKKEYAIQRYVYQNKGSLLASIYNWVNRQIIALGLKSYGVSPLGYLIFWSFVSFLLMLVIEFVFKFNIALFVLFWALLFVCLLVVTRVTVSERMEKRESDIMDAVDLIIPEIHIGVKNAIIRYKDNFPPSLYTEFEAFISNIQDRGYSFTEAMYILADQLGEIFYDFSQKAIYYEAVGESDMIDIFSDISERNRLRRELRDRNNIRFSEKRKVFAISVVMLIAYFVFLSTFSDFFRLFFFHTTCGTVSLVVMVLLIFATFSYVATIKSRAI